jgi:hypothetical protein
MVDTPFFSSLDLREQVAEFCISLRFYVCKPILFCLREQLSAKDNRILELSEQVAELGRKVFDLEENLREKDEVIAAR